MPKCASGAWFDWNGPPPRIQRRCTVRVAGLAEASPAGALAETSTTAPIAWRFPTRVSRGITTNQSPVASWSLRITRSGAFRPAITASTSPSWSRSANTAVRSTFGSSDQLPASVRWMNRAPTRSMSSGGCAYDVSMVSGVAFG